MVHKGLHGAGKLQTFHSRKCRNPFHASHGNMDACDVSPLEDHGGSSLLQAGGGIGIGQTHHGHHALLRHGGAAEGTRHSGIVHTGGLEGIEAYSAKPGTAAKIQG